MMKLNKFYADQLHFDFEISLNDPLDPQGEGLAILPFAAAGADAAGRAHDELILDDPDFAIAGGIDDLAPQLELLFVR